jgi:hypothetical protein
LANTSTYTKELIKGRFKYRQILVSGVAGEVPTLEDLRPGDLALNVPDRQMYTANDTAVYAIMDVDFDVSAFVSNAYAQATFITQDFANTNFVWNVGYAADIPSGNNANRPSPAGNGYFRYNTDLESFEGYAAGQWVTIDYAGGSNTWVQFNDSKYFNGSAGFTFDKSTNNVTVGNTLTSVIFASGNSTANLFANSILVKVANSTGIANLQPGLLTIGTSVVNSTVIAAGANVLIDTVSIKVGNSTANLFANSILLQFANADGTANLKPTSLTIGVSIVNVTSVSVGGTGAMVINSTSYAAGANVLIDATHIFVGNSTANLSVNSILATIANSTGIANLQPGLLTIGTSVVNTTAFAEGANVIIDTVKLFVGNSTVNTVVNSIAAVFSGTVTVNSSQATVGANVFLSTTVLSIGNSTANLLANSILVSVANATGIANLQPTQLVIGVATVNASAFLSGANVFLDTTKLSVGNSTANLLANSILVSLANSTATANLQPNQLVIGGAVVNTTAFYMGANIILSATGLGVGNSTVNAVVISANLTYSNSTMVSYINPAGLTAGANVFLNTTTLSVGNSTANLLANSILISVANATATANLQPTQLVIGSATVNTTAHIAGANVFLDTTRLFVGNSTVNATVNSTAFALNGVAITGGAGGSPGGANTQVQFNDSGAFLGTAGFTFDKATNNATIANTLTIGGFIANTTLIKMGANVLIDTVKISVGNSTANLLANSIIVQVANATGTANLQPTQLVIGSATVNATAFLTGANVFLDTTRLSIGNSTVNVSINSSSLFVNGLQVAIVPTVQVFVANGTWTRPTGCKKVKVTVVGGGGGGGAGVAVTQCCAVVPGQGGGGGAGGAGIKFSDVTGTSSVAVTVPPAAGTGAAGGTVSFGAVVSATGGSAGAGGSGATGAGGAGGVGSSGDVNATGGTGYGGGSGGGAGASTIFGGGATAAATANSVGAAGQGYGGGGGGGTRSGLAGTNNGGAGKIGIVIVEEYY